jgi:hypothetical protein
MMPFPATNAKPPGELPEIIKLYLQFCGVREKKIATCNMGTRLYHDLGIYGEEAEDDLEVLTKEYQVDLSGFVFERYFPYEWPQGHSKIESFFLGLLPGIERLYRKPTTFLPITLAMIARAIDAKKWVE